MKSLFHAISILLIGLLIACQDNMTLTYNNGSIASLSSAKISDGARIAILSDIHVMHPSLLIHDGTAFQNYLAQDPKLLEYSAQILEATISKLITQKPDLVLVAGDLTKDGELISHEFVSRQLQRLVSHGIKVLVTVGNHDVNNPEAAKFDGDKVYPAENVPANKIRSIYPNFGFANSLSKDPNSLSYVNEPIKDLWVIAIDANEYYNNKLKSTIGGIIKNETMAWIKERMDDAKRKGKTVIGMMHHNLIEHYYGQSVIDTGYVVNNSETVANELMEAGLKIIFTGHYHANDITKREHNGKFIFDVETGSTLNYPCTYRMLTIKGNKYSFTPQTTTDLMPSVMGMTFDTYAKAFLSAHLDGYFAYLLTMAKGVPSSYATQFAPWYRAGFMAHCMGDESPTSDLATQTATLNALDPSGQLSGILGSFWTDINTPDNTVTLDLETGSAY